MAVSEPLRPGDIVIVPFPYADQLAEKRRPALVVSAEPFNARHGLAWVAMITSAANPAWDGDVTIADQAAAGLPAPSIVRTAKIATIEPERVVRMAGRIAEEEMERVRGMIAGTIG
ncbi:MAG: type II toxin-antitoxin system PemK/MazF family toxin [Aestuariivirga sp.]